MRHICKMEKLKIRAAVIKYFYKKGMPPKEVHEDFMETLRKASPSYIVRPVKRDLAVLSKDSPLDFSI